MLLLFAAAYFIADGSALLMARPFYRIARFSFIGFRYHAKVSLRSFINTHYLLDAYGTVSRRHALIWHYISSACLRIIVDFMRAAQ